MRTDDVSLGMNFTTAVMVLYGAAKLGGNRHTRGICACVCKPVCINQIKENEFIIKNVRKIHAKRTGRQRENVINKNIRNF